MSGAVAFGLWLLAWAPNHQLLLASVDAADALEHRLVPWRTITESVLPLWIVWLPETPSGFSGATGAALYLPAEEWQSYHALALGGAERLLPRLAVPRLLLAERHYRAPGGVFKKLEELAPDSAERLLHALLGAHLRQRMRSDGDFAGELDRRADALLGEEMGELPAEARRDAYTGALVDFAAHVLSISHEIGRHQRRRLSRGETLCAVRDHPVSLFGSWRRAIAEGEYRGYRPLAADQGPARWVPTEARLERADKEWMLDSLGITWADDPTRDFRFLCRGG